MTLNLGTVRPGSTILIPFNAFDSNDPSASVIVSDFILGDIGIYKGTSMTERASTTGVVEDEPHDDPFTTNPTELRTSALGSSPGEPVKERTVLPWLSRNSIVTCRASSRRW